jgi:hypothetical protein
MEIRFWFWFGRRPFLVSCVFAIRPLSISWLKCVIKTGDRREGKDDPSGIPIFGPRPPPLGTRNDVTTSHQHARLNTSSLQGILL